MNPKAFLACLPLLGGLTLPHPAWAQHQPQPQSQGEHKMIGVRALAFSPDGRWLAAGSIEEWASPGDLRVWDTQSGKLLHRERYVYGVESVAFSPDGKTLAVATDVEQAKDAIRLWNVRVWRVERALGREQYINSLAFSPDGKQLLAGSNMGENGETENTYLWNIATRRSQILPRSNGLGQMLFSPNRSLILGGFYSGYNNGDNEDLRAWDAKGHFLWQHPQPGLSDIAFLPDGRSFMAGVGPLNQSQSQKKTGGALQIRDATTGRLLQTIKQSTGVSVVAVSRDGKLWATGNADGAVSLWDARTRRVVKTRRLHQDGIRQLVFSPDGRALASAGADDRVLLTSISGF